MKKILIIVLMCFVLLGITGCGCGRVADKSSAFYKKELSFDFKSMDTISSDIRKAIEAGIEDATPVEMKDGHFRIERNNYSYDYEEGTAKTKVNFYNFEIDAQANENSSHILFKGLITIDFESIVDGSEYGGNYTIKNKNNKVIEFEIDNYGKTIYDEKTGNFTIVIPELKEKGTIVQKSQSTTITNGGNEDVGKVVTNNWDIDEMWDDIKIVFVPHNESK